MSVKKSEQCNSCNSNPRFSHHKKLLPQCEECYRDSIKDRLRVRKMSRVLEVGKPLEYNDGDGWRVGYMLKFGSYNDVHIQPVGAIGRVPDITSVKLVNVQQATCGSPSMPTVEDFYRKMKRPVVLVATPPKAAPVFAGLDLASGHDRAVTFEHVTARLVSAVQESQARTGQTKKSSILAGEKYGDWTTIAYTGHSRWSCVNAAGEKKLVYAAELKAARGVVAAAASI